MTLIKSISGIRGTIGGPAGDTLNPLDIVKFTSAYATFIRRSGASKSNTIVVGRDARISGEMVKNVVCGTLMGMGYDVLNIGLATTPTSELAVTMSGAAGGIIITASHNPRQWNALKLLNEKGEFLTAANGSEVLSIAEKEDFDSAAAEMLASHSWPGNLRELNNVVKRAVLLTRGKLITTTELSMAMGPTKPIPVATLHDEDTERSRIIAALQQTNGNKAKAARLLGVDRKTIYNKIEKLGIEEGL